jgi:hypothetical protein
MGSYGKPISETHDKQIAPFNLRFALGNATSNLPAFIRSVFPSKIIQRMTPKKLLK